MEEKNMWVWDLPKAQWVLDQARLWNKKVCPKFLLETMYRKNLSTQTTKTTFTYTRC